MTTNEYRETKILNGDDQAWLHVEKLVALESCKPKADKALPEQLKKICTPFKREAWQWMLRDYPDQQAAQLIIQGISEGFRIGFDYNNHTLQSCDRNVISTRQHPEVVSVRSWSWAESQSCPLKT